MEKNYIKNVSKLIKQIISMGDARRLTTVFKKTEFVTKRNIEKYINQCIDEKQHELVAIMLNYQNEIGGIQKE